MVELILASRVRQIERGFTLLHSPHDFVETSSLLLALIVSQDLQLFWFSTISALLIVCSAEQLGWQTVCMSYALHQVVLCMAQSARVRGFILKFLSDGDSNTNHQFVQVTFCARFQRHRILSSRFSLRSISGTACTSWFMACSRHMHFEQIRGHCVVAVLPRVATSLCMCKLVGCKTCVSV